MPEPISAAEYEKLGLFYLGRPYDLQADAPLPGALLYDSRDLLTHALCVGMTGSGKTGLCISLLEEAAIDGVPALVIDPKGDLGNLMLTFPDLTPEQFLPWVEEESATRQGISKEELAAREAKKWSDGLAKWGQDAARVRRLREAAEVAIYTPGSSAGRPLAVLSSLAAPPPDVREDVDLLRDKVSTTVGGILGLLGIDADPVRSREHILLSTLVERAWTAGFSLELADLVQQVQSPPVQQIGVLQLEAVFPEKERIGFAMTLNNLLASPGFGAWRDGEPLDVDRLLYTETGKPRIAICSIGHLGDKERMFFVTLLLGQVLAWMRTKAGTTSLRALLYMDEVFGYLPPVAEPPSKRPLITLLKQARAFGLGVVLATQNPADLDYKALTNIGTWMLGRLQADRDKQRLLDGLEGAAQGAGPSRQELDELISRLRNRLFLLHDVHQPGGPVVFETRWAMSYLRGPLTRQEVRKLSSATAPPPAPVAPPPGASAGAVGAAGGTLGAGVAAAPARLGTKPQNEPPARIPQLWEGDVTGTASPAVLGRGRVTYKDARRGIDQAEDVVLVAALPADGSDPEWASARPLLATALRQPPAGASPGELPASAAGAASWKAWEAAFKRHLADTAGLTLWRSPSLGELSRPGEGERELRIRLAERAREERNTRLDAVRQRWAKKAEQAHAKVERAQQAVHTQEGQKSGQQMQAAISIGATVLGALFGRRSLSGTLGRATTAARGFGRASREGEDVARAQAKLQEAQAELAEVERATAAELSDVEVRFHPETEALEEVRLNPRTVEVTELALLWRAG